jgi:hypothetical protein
MAFLGIVAPRRTRPSTTDSKSTLAIAVGPLAIHPYSSRYFDLAEVPFFRHRKWFVAVV